MATTMTSSSLSSSSAAESIAIASHDQKEMETADEVPKVDNGDDKNSNSSSSSSNPVELKDETNCNVIKKESATLDDVHSSSRAINNTVNNDHDAAAATALTSLATAASVVSSSSSSTSSPSSSSSSSYSSSFLRPSFIKKEQIKTEFRNDHKDDNDDDDDMVLGDDNDNDEDGNVSSSNTTKQPTTESTTTAIAPPTVTPTVLLPIPGVGNTTTATTMESSSTSNNNDVIADSSVVSGVDTTTKQQQRHVQLQKQAEQSIREKDQTSSAFSTTAQVTETKNVTSTTVTGSRHETPPLVATVPTGTGSHSQVPAPAPQPPKQSSVVVDFNFILSQPERWLDQSEKYFDNTLREDTTTIVTPKPFPYDVLCGRGGETNHHPGNVRYRQLVKAYQRLYIDAKRRDKPRIAQCIVYTIRVAGGRFLKRTSTTTTTTTAGGGGSSDSSTTKTGTNGSENPLSAPTSEAAAAATSGGTGKDPSNEQMGLPSYHGAPTKNDVSGANAQHGVTWVDVGNPKAREKTSQALREGQADIKRSLDPTSADGDSNSSPVDTIGAVSGRSISPSSGVTDYEVASYQQNQSPGHPTYYLHHPHHPPTRHTHAVRGHRAQSPSTSVAGRPMSHAELLSRHQASARPSAMNPHHPHHRQIHGQRHPFPHPSYLHPSHRHQQQQQRQQQQQQQLAPKHRAGTHGADDENEASVSMAQPKLSSVAAVAAELLQNPLFHRLTPLQQEELLVEEIHAAAQKYREKHELQQRQEQLQLHREQHQKQQQQQQSLQREDPKEQIELRNVKNLKRSAPSLVEATSSSSRSSSPSSSPASTGKGGPRLKRFKMRSNWTDADM